MIFATGLSYLDQEEWEALFGAIVVHAALLHLNYFEYKL
jgi:hypothetical protein